MTSISVPLWLALLVAALALWATLDRLLIPSARWFLRRRLNRVLEEIHTRLKIQKKPPVEADKPASTGPSRDRSRDLSDEADRQDEEFRKRSRK